MKIHHICLFLSLTLFGISNAFAQIVNYENKNQSSYLYGSFSLDISNKEIVNYNLFLNFNDVGGPIVHGTETNFWFNNGSSISNGAYIEAGTRPSVNILNMFYGWLSPDYGNLNQIVFDVGILMHEYTYLPEFDVSINTGFSPFLSQNVIFTPSVTQSSAVPEEKITLLVLIGLLTILFGKCYPLMRLQQLRVA